MHSFHSESLEPILLYKSGDTLQIPFTFYGANIFAQRFVKRIETVGERDLHLRNQAAVGSGDLAVTLGDYMKYHRIVGPVAVMTVAHPI